MPNVAIIAFESRDPFGAVDNKWDLTDNVIKIYGSHNLKAGTYIERTQRWAKRPSTFNGSFDFGRDPTNPRSSYSTSGAVRVNIATLRSPNRRQCPA